MLTQRASSMSLALDKKIILYNMFRKYSIFYPMSFNFLNFRHIFNDTV